jgi:transmembrane sensor
MRDEPTPESSPTPAQEEAAEAWLLRLASGAMSADELAQFKRWLERDAGNRAAFAQVRSLWYSLGVFRQDFGLEDWEEQGSGSAAVLPTTATHGNDGRLSKSTRSGHRRLAWATIAALIACVLGVAGMSTDFAALFLADYRTGVGAQASVTLSDGSVVHLNTDTAIAVRYTHNRRLVRLVRGEAAFVVAPDPIKPFRVVAEDGVTQAMGTTFLVRKSTDQVIVTFADGTVVVHANVAAQVSGLMEGVGPWVSLRGGEQISYGGAEGLGRVQTVDVEQVSAWRLGKLIFDGGPFAEAIAELDRYLPGRILIVKGHLGETRVGGIFNLSELDDAIAALAITQRLRSIRLTRLLILLH